MGVGKKVFFSPILNIWSHIFFLFGFFWGILAIEEIVPHARNEYLHSAVGQEHFAIIREVLDEIFLQYELDLEQCDYAIAEFLFGSNRVDNTWKYKRELIWQFWTGRNFFCSVCFLAEFFSFIS